MVGLKVRKYQKLTKTKKKLTCNSLPFRIWSKRAALPSKAGGGLLLDLLLSLPVVAFATEMAGPGPGGGGGGGGGGGAELGTWGAAAGGGGGGGGGGGAAEWCLGTDCECAVAGGTDGGGGGGGAAERVEGRRGGRGVCGASLTGTGGGAPINKIINYYNSMEYHTYSDWSIQI